MNKKSADDRHPETLYQHYRTMPATTEEKIDTAITSALGRRDALMSQRNQPAILDDGIDLQPDELRVLDAYREFQSTRGDSPVFDEQLDADVAKVMSNVTPMIRERAPKAFATPAPKNNWNERVRERVTAWTAPLGAFAMAAVAVVAITLFSTTQPMTPSLGELTGIAAYEKIGGLNLSKNLTTNGTGTLGFSAGQDATMASYAVGSLGGELSIAMSGNDRIRSEAILGQISLLATTAATLATDNQLSTASDNLKRAMNESSETQLMNDASVVDGLGNLLGTIQDISANAGTIDLTLLGSWTALTSVLVDAAAKDDADPRLTSLIERAVGDASDLHQRLARQPTLSDGQRQALDSFIAANHDLSSPAALKKLQLAIRRLDTSFRV